MKYSFSAFENGFVRAAAASPALRVADCAYNAQQIIAAMRAQGVLVRDCSNYRNLTLGWYRVAVRTHEENLRLLAALDAVLPQLTKEA